MRRLAPQQAPDVGNLLVHLELLGLRSGYEPAEVETALLDGYLARCALEMRTSTKAAGSGE